MNVEHEVNLLVEEIHRLGSKNADGKLSVKFGVLFQDDRCANLFEALVGTLKAAKRRKIVTYTGDHSQQNNKIMEKMLTLDNPDKNENLSDLTHKQKV